MNHPRVVPIHPAAGILRALREIQAEVTLATNCDISTSIRSRAGHKARADIRDLVSNLEAELRGEGSRLTDTSDPGPTEPPAMSLANLDSERLDQLEEMVRECGALVLHTGQKGIPTGTAPGLGFGTFAPCHRTLRQAIDGADR